MKLSLAWIFDHIEGDWLTQDVDHIARRFNQVTAEIEHVTPVSFNVEKFFIVTVTGNNQSSMFIPELNKEVALTQRLDLIATLSDEIFYCLVKQTNDQFTWATLADFGVDKGGLVPSLDITSGDLAGGWRAAFTTKDVLLEVDNKSITHRPDMWGHRGFAREIAAYLGLPLKPKEYFLKTLDVKRYDHESVVANDMPFVVKNQAPGACFAFNGLYVPSFVHKPSNPFLASRLMTVGARPMNVMVDITNYIAWDWGQPVHAYDADRIAQKTVVIRKAKAHEKLNLLDGNEISLTTDDLIIADAAKPLCLAGVKGGADDSVSAATKAVFFEAANFEAATVRRSAMHHKTRTDSSMRFEKTLDPNMAIEAVFRFVKLLEQCGMQATCAPSIIAIGKEVTPLIIEVRHDYLERSSGITLTSDAVVELLTPLGFGVSIKYSEPLIYEVVVPTFRSSKDIKHKEDILEEVVRAYGFDKITLVVPPMKREPFDTKETQRIRKIRQFCAYGIGMMEQRNYALFDEPFLEQLEFPEQKTVTIVNPVSEHYARLITTLIPGLLKNVSDNIVHHDVLSFFEFGRIWKRDGIQAVEQESLSGIFFEKRKPIDFYLCKHYVTELFRLLGFTDALEWRKIDSNALQWYHPYQRAELYYQHEKVGFAGILNPLWLPKIGGLPESQAFIFELDASFLRHQTVAVPEYRPISRFQDTFFDLSLQVPLAVSSQSLIIKLQDISALVRQVELIDFYEPQAQKNIRSLTYRVWLQHADRTLGKDEIDVVYRHAVEEIQQTGAQLRA